MGERRIKKQFNIKFDYFFYICLIFNNLNILFMKKLLLLITLVLSIQYISAQTLQSDTFNALTIGNVGTNFTGASAGQGSFLTSASNGTAPTTTTNAGNSNFQIVSTGNNSSNGVQLQGPNGAGGGMYMWKNGLVAAFGSRTTGNNIIEAEVDFYTGGTTTSTGFTGIYLFDSSYNIINGLIYTNNTRLLRGAATLNNAGTIGVYTINLATGGLILNANTWYRLGFGYNTVTGQPTWRLNTSTGTSTIASANWATPTLAPFEIDLASEAGTGNTVSFSVVFDNFVVRASATDTLLQNDTFDLTSTNFSVSPNPTTDFITVSNLENILVNAISITDLNGRVVKQNSYSNVTNVQVNVSDLASGVYLMSITSEKGTTTKKIIKN
jgi:hypothetical protein